MKLTSFKELFIVLLSDIYNLETKLVTEVPKISQRVHSEELKEALSDHLSETKEQVKRLDKIFKLLNAKPVRIEWAHDIKALFTDVEKVLKDNPPSPLLDAAIIAIVQRIEHFEIATYGTLREYAQVLDIDEVKAIFKETLKEECKADTLLTKIAKGGGINEAATRNV